MTEISLTASGGHPGVTHRGVEGRDTEAMISQVARFAGAHHTDRQIAETTRSSVLRVASDSVRAGLVYGTSLIGGHAALEMAPKLLVDGATAEGILGVGVGVAAAAGVALGVTLTRSAIAEVRRMMARITTPSFDRDLASRGTTLLFLGATSAPALLLGSIVGGDATPALLAAGFMGVVSAAAGSMAAQVASMRALRDERDAVVQARGGSGVI